MLSLPGRLLHPTRPPGALLDERPAACMAPGQQGAFTKSCRYCAGQYPAKASIPHRPAAARAGSQQQAAPSHLQGAAELGFRGRQPPLHLVPLGLRRRRRRSRVCRRGRQLALVLLAQGRQRRVVLLVHSSQGGGQLAQLLRSFLLPPRCLLRLLLPVRQLGLCGSELLLQLLLPPAALRPSRRALRLQPLRHLSLLRDLLPRRRQLATHSRHLGPAVRQFGSQPLSLGHGSLLLRLASRL